MTSKLKLGLKRLMKEAGYPANQTSDDHDSNKTFGVRVMTKDTNKMFEIRALAKDGQVSLYPRMARRDHGKDGKMP